MTQQTIQLHAEPNTLGDEKTMIRLFTTTHCPSCSLTKKYLTDKKISFKEINLDNDMQAAQEMVELSGQLSVPVLDVNGEIVIGYNRPAIEHALAKQR